MLEFVFRSSNDGFCILLLAARQWPITLFICPLFRTGVLLNLYISGLLSFSLFVMYNARAPRFWKIYIFIWMIKLFLAALLTSCIYNGI